MKRRLSNQRTGGLTLVEVMVSIAVVAVAAVVFIPRLQPRRTCCRCGPNCISNLKHKGAGNIGLGDGGAHQVTINGLRKQIQAALLSTNVDALRFSIPKPN